MDISSLKTIVLSGVIWKGLERICAQLVSTIVSVVLARILTPDDYSIVSIAAIFFTFCNLFISGGLNTSLIQKKNADELDYSTILSTNMVFAAVLYAVMYFCAPFIAQLYDKPLIVSVIRIMALTFFINGYKAVLTAKISSEMKFKKFFGATIGGTIISAIVGIIMAIKGCGVWALVAQQMINSMVDSIILTVTTRYKFKFRFSLTRFKGLFSYGGKIFLASIITTIYDECRPLIVGVKFSPKDLAFYNKGSSFPSMINSIGNNTLSSSLFPAMAKIQDEKESLLRVTSRFMKLSSFLVFPMMLGMLAISENFIKIVLTERWLPVVPYMKIFSFAFMLDLIQVGNLQSIRALGRSDLILKMEIIKKVSYAIVIIFAVMLFPSPIALASTGIVTSIIATIVNTIPNKGLIGYGFIKLLKDILPNLLPATVMALIVLMMNRINCNMYLLLILQVVSGAAVYLGLCIVLKNESFCYLRESIKEMLKNKK